MGFFEKIHGWNLPQTNSGMNGVVIWTGWLASEELGRRTCKNQMCDLHRVTLIHLYIYNIYPYIYTYNKNWLGTNKWMRWSTNNDQFLPRLFDKKGLPSLDCTPRDDLPGPISGWTLPVQDMPPICHQWTATKLMDCWLLSLTVLEKPTLTTHVWLPDMAVSKTMVHPGTLVNMKIAGKWMFIPKKHGIDWYKSQFLVSRFWYFVDPSPYLCGINHGPNVSALWNCRETQSRPAPSSSSAHLMDGMAKSWLPQRPFWA